jgi:hypothetical protein
MQSTETMMKFGFMSMSMTYFSSMNMVKAMRTVSAQDTVMAALADVHAQRAVGYAGPGGAGGGGGDEGARKAPFLPDLKAGQLPGQQLLRVSAWSVEDVAKWLQSLSLGQYSEAFIDSAVDGEFLYDLNDDDLKNTLGIEHRLHRKKILNCVHRLKLAEAQKDNKLNELLRESGNLDAPVRVSPHNAHYSSVTLQTQRSFFIPFFNVLFTTGHCARYGRGRQFSEQPFQVRYCRFRRRGWTGRRRPRWRGRRRDDRRPQHPDRGADLAGAPQQAGHDQGRAGLPAQQEVRQVPRAGALPFHAAQRNSLSIFFL